MRVELSCSVIGTWWARHLQGVLQRQEGGASVVVVDA